MHRVITVALLLLCGQCRLSAQTAAHLTDGRSSDLFCINYQRLIDSRPKEVQFGIDIQENGDVFFEMGNDEWFKKLFTPGMAITVDIVSKDRYDCGKVISTAGLFRGAVLPPLKWEDFAKRRVPLQNGLIFIKIGKLPAELQKRQLEGNLVIVHEDKVCYYTNFVDIPRAAWDLLPMGLYMDTLVNLSPEPDSVTGVRFTWQQKTELIVNFEKNQSSYGGTVIQKMIDSLHLDKCILRKVDVRAYASVEGTEDNNRQLMKARAGNIVARLKKLRPGLTGVHVLTTENWIEFYRDIESTRFAYLGGFTRPAIKAKLFDRSLADSLEPMLAKERKAIVTIWYEQRQSMSELPRDQLVSAFARAVSAKQIDLARRIQRQIFEMVGDNRLPDSYLDQLEVPAEKTYWELINDRIIFRYQTDPSAVMEVLQAFRQLSALDPGNGRVAYNRCAFALYAWQLSADSVDKQQLLTDIGQLGALGIDPSLVKRLSVNYHILLSDYLMTKEKYDEKDKAVQFIKESYEGFRLTDDDRFSLAKYFSFYSQQGWAEQLIAGRVDQLDVSEDLVFYYVNLGFFKDPRLRGEKFGKALINCFTLNRERFCRFFYPNDKGGAGMQLLEQDEFRQLYCEKCRSMNSL